MEQIKGDKEKFIVFLTGASGVGKTTIVDNLEEKYAANRDWAFEHFDSVHIPSSEEMIKEYGSGSAWQEAKTHEWVNKFVNNYSDKKVIVFEGQVNIDFINSAFAKSDFSNYKIILIDCDEEEMVSRLTHERRQPELVNNDMKNWLRFLRRQAKDLNISIIDTTEKSDPGIIEEFNRIVNIGNHEF